MGSSTAPLAMENSSESNIQVSNDMGASDTEMQEDGSDVLLDDGVISNNLIETEKSQQVISTKSYNQATEHLSYNGISSDSKKIIVMNSQITNGENNQENITVEPEQVEQIFSRNRNRWYTNEEVASILTNFSSHPEWQTNELQVRPKSGAVLLYSREKVRYRQDGYCWKKRKNGRTTREDHMKLKVQGIECIYGCYVHSAILPTFHRRCYWLLENPDIVLVHYLNQPQDDQNKMILTFNSSALEADTRRAWTNEEIIEEIGSVFGGISQIQHTLNLNFPSGATEQSLVSDSNNVLAHTDQSSSQLLVGNTSANNEPSSFNQEKSSNTEIVPCANNDRSTSTLKDNNGESERIKTTEEYSNMIESRVSGDNYIVSGIKCDTNGDGNNNDNDRDTTTRSIIEDDDEMIVQDTNNHINDQKVPQSIRSDERGHQESDSCEDSSRSEHRGLFISSNTIDPMAYEFNNGGSNQQQHQQNHQNHQQQDHRTNTTSSISADRDEVKINTDTRNLCDQLMDQSSCSPVTQIYNKIVDDIETYALPIEPNQFGHHHVHQHHEHHEIESMDVSESPNDGTKLDRRHSSQLSAELGDCTHISNNDQHKHHHHHHPLVSDEAHSIQANGMPRRLELNGGNQSDCSAVDLVSCDLFGEMNQEDADQHVNTNAGDDILLSEFELTASDGVAGHVPNDLVGTNSTVDGLRHGDDLRDLMMGISCPDGDGTSPTSNLLVDTSTLDLFNFKTTTLEQRQNHQHQLDIKSTTSDTDTLNRLSPIASLVPRCNSTDNALQRLDHHHQYQQQHHHHQMHHMSNHYLNTTTTQFGDLASTFSEFQQNYTHNYQSFGNNNNNVITGNLEHHRSTANSTNPSNSTSCSPSPSSSSLLASGLTSSSTGTGNGSGGNTTLDSGVANQSSSIATRSNDLELGSSQHCSSSLSSTNSGAAFMKLPLQQRQHSEQKEPSNNVLSTLLPKALSLDGSDLSNTGYSQLTPNHHHHHQQHHHQYIHTQQHSRGITSPLVGAYASHHYNGNNTTNIGTCSNQNSNLQHQQLVPSSIDLGRAGSGVNGGQSRLQRQSFNQSSMTHRHIRGSHREADIVGFRNIYQRPSVPSLSSEMTTSPLVGGFYSTKSANGQSGLSQSMLQQRSGSIATTGYLTHHQHYGSNTMEYSKLQTQSIVTNSRLIPILDYVPNWSICTGGTKVLIIGNWSEIVMTLDSNVDRPQHIFTDDMRQMQLMNDNFHALFDEIIVPATLIQNNVLRCHAPMRDPGFVALRVVYKSTIISEQVLFEMRGPPASTAAGAASIVIPDAGTSTTTTTTTTTLSSSATTTPTECNMGTETTSANANKS